MVAERIVLVAAPPGLRRMPTICTLAGVRAEERIMAAHPHDPQFEEDIIQAFDEGIRRKPDTTFGKADVPADKDPHSHAGDFCSVIRHAPWTA